MGRDVAHYMLMGGKAPMEVAKTYEKGKKRKRGRDHEKERQQDRDFDL